MFTHARYADADADAGSESQPFTAATWSPISVGVEGPVPTAPGDAQRGMSISYNQPGFPVGGQSVYFAPGCIG